MSLYNYFDQKLNKPDLGLLALRVVFGLTIFIFGVQKLMGGGAMFEQIGGSMAMFGITWEPKFWGLLCALAETFGGLCLLLGVFTRPVALILTFNMLVACVAMAKMAGNPDTASLNAFNEWLGKVAVPAYFLAAFIALLFCGPGKYSIHKSGGGGGKAKASKE